MIASVIDIEKVKAGRRTQLWLPAERGDLGELRPCPLEWAVVYPLQPEPFVKGQVKITIVSVEQTTLGEMTDEDARRQGYVSLQLVKDRWARQHGDASDEWPAWKVDFVRETTVEGKPKWRTFLIENQTRYLNAKMGGARDYTYDPAKGVPGEGPALGADELELLGAAAERRAEEREAERRAELAGLPIEERLARLEELARQRGVNIDRELRLIEHRVEQAEHVAKRPVHTRE